MLQGCNLVGTRHTTPKVRASGCPRLVRAHASHQHGGLLLLEMRQARMCIEQCTFGKMLLREMQQHSVASLRQNYEHESRAAGREHPRCWHCP